MPRNVFNLGTKICLKAPNNSSNDRNGDYLRTMKVGKFQVPILSNVLMQKRPISISVVSSASILQHILPFSEADERRDRGWHVERLKKSVLTLVVFHVTVVTKRHVLHRLATHVKMSIPLPIHFFRKKNSLIFFCLINH